MAMVSFLLKFFPAKCHALAVYLVPAQSLSTLQWELVPAESLEDEQEKKSRDIIWQQWYAVMMDEHFGKLKPKVP